MANQSKADQLRALREMNAAKSSGRTDEVMAREEKPKVGGVSRKPPKAIQAGMGSERSSPETKLAGGEAVTQRTVNAPTAGSNPARSAKLGRPRIGEERDKPWLTCDPPMSRSTWYRRQRENK